MVSHARIETSGDAFRSFILGWPVITTSDFKVIMSAGPCLQ
jgi:hypothetical protein